MPTFQQILKPSLIMLTASVLSVLSLPSSAHSTAPISGFARSFLMGMELRGGTITILETGKKIQTDKYGHFGPFQYPVGQPITLQFEKWGYKTTQSETAVVPPDGFSNPYNNITFQIPSIESFYLLANIIGAKIDENSCHVTATVTGYHKTMDDLPQGESDAIVTITPAVKETPFYFDIYKSGPLKGKTNPFTRGLTQTSEDGGIAYFNLPPRKEAYTLSAQKNGKQFTDTRFICKKGAFINISPPRGPMALQ